jgi:actin-related protein 5
LKIRDRSRRKAALSDRKSAASQARMKSIANLAADEKTGRKKRKEGGGLSFCDHSCLSNTWVVDDMFGANDDDWAIYRKIVGPRSAKVRNNLLKL